MNQLEIKAKLSNLKNQLISQIEMSPLPWVGGAFIFGLIVASFPEFFFTLIFVLIVGGIIAWLLLGNKAKQSVDRREAEDTDDKLKRF